jgi:hypothetical protein
MTEFSLPHVSVASSGGEYFEVLFTQEEGSYAQDEDCDDAYFLIQRQFESPDGGRVYLESHHVALCGHFRIRNAVLRRGVLQLEVVCQPAESVRIRFQADLRSYERLKTVLRTIMPRRVLTIE